MSDSSPYGALKLSKYSPLHIFQKEFNCHWRWGIFHGMDRNACAGSECLHSYISNTISYSPL